MSYELLTQAVTDLGTSNAELTQRAITAVEAAELSSNTAQTAADQATTAKVAVDIAVAATQEATEQTVASRNSAEAFAVNVLTALSSTQGLTLQARQAALEAADSALAAEETANTNMAILAADGAPLIGLVQPVGPPMTIGEFLLRNKFICLTGDMLQAFIDFASASGGRDVTLVPNLVYEMGLTTLEIKSGVELKTDVGNAMSVQHVVTGNLRGLATLRFGAITGDAVLVRSNAFNNSLHSFIIDNALQVSGHGIHCSDTDGVQRVGTKIRNVFVYKRGLGAGLWVKPGHKEGSSHEVFVRNGIGVATGTEEEKLAQLAGDGQYGVVIEAVDWDSNRILCGFARERGFLYTGGACRFRDVDVWGCQDINAEIQGTSITIDRLQVDGAGNGGLLVNGGDDVVINKLISINNCLTALVPTDDIIIRGECRSLSFDQVRLRGSAGMLRYGIAMEDTATGIGNIGDLSFASSYLDGMNDRARAYINVSAMNNALSPARGHARHIENLTVNPLFTKWTTGVPDGFSVRGNAVPTQITPVGMTTGKYISGAHIVSGAVGVSGIQVILDKDKYKGRRLYCGGWFKGSGSTYLGNQRVQLFDGVNTFVEIIPNDNQWHWIAIDKQMDINATDVQIRLVAANDTTPDLALDMTAVYYWAY
jgi:hypothetical protein